MQTFEIESVLRSAWETFKKHWLYVWTLCGIYFGIVIFFSLLEKRFDTGFLHFVITVLSFITGVILQVGFLKGFLDLVLSDKEGGVEVLFSQYKLFWRYFGANLLFQIMVVLGFILLIVPGIYLLLRFQFFSYALVDKNLGILDALKKSSEITEGVKWKLLGFCFVILLLNIMGALFLGIGLLVTIPVSMLSTVYVYVELTKQREKTEATGISSTPVDQTITPVS